MSNFKNKLKNVGEKSLIGAALGGLGLGALGSYYGYNLDPQDVVNDPALSPQSSEFLNQLSPEEQRWFIAASAAIPTGIAGAVMGGLNGALYGLGQNSGSKRTPKPKSKEEIKESMYFNNRTIKSLTQIIEEATKSNIEIKHPGAFTKWCKQQGFKGVTCECIKKGLASKNPHVRKMANFARNFGHPECK